jgi:hypothetical protein
VKKDLVLLYSIGYQMKILRINLELRYLGVLLNTSNRHCIITFKIGGRVNIIVGI